MNEAELLFTELLKCKRLDLCLNKGARIDREMSSRVGLALKRRVAGEPIQYILGKAEFMGLEFKVTPDVFIPRPETEILVETTLEAVSKLGPFSPFKILDIGTGSGCIVVSLAKFLPHAEISASEISQAALEVAKENAKINGVKINFIQSDLFSTFGLRPIAYDLMISNPPYIASAEIDALQPEIRCEPRVALDGGGDGLKFYRSIIHESPGYLKDGGYLIMEMGFSQKEAIQNLVRESRSFKIIESIRDYNDIDRVIVLQKGA